MIFFPSMNRHLLFVLASLSLLLGATTSARELSADEVADLKQRIETMMASFEAGDLQALFDQTHESLFRLVGGRASFERITRQAVAGIMEAGVTFESSELGTPTPLHEAGDEDVCFVPRVSVMVVNGRRAKSTGFMIAIRPAAGGDWRFLDGTGLRKNPRLLETLLPELSRNLELPPNEIELL